MRLIYETDLSVYKVFIKKKERNILKQNIIKFRKKRKRYQNKSHRSDLSLGQRMSECLEGFVSAVKALFPISTQTYHQEGKLKEYTLRTTFSSSYFSLTNSREQFKRNIRTIEFHSELILFTCKCHHLLYLMSGELVCQIHFMHGIRHVNIQGKFVTFTMLIFPIC